VPMPYVTEVGAIEQVWAATVSISNSIAAETLYCQLATWQP
jgi:hypothetical protein